MAHYAFLDSNNVVTEVIVGVNENELIEGLSPEIWYGNFRNQVCKRTSYNTYGGVHSSGGDAYRKNYAGIGYTYNSARDAFIPPKPFSSWILNTTTCLWNAPTPMPTDDKRYMWKEETVSWVEVA